MTPERFAGIKIMLAKKFPTPSEMVDAREAAKELVVALDEAALWRVELLSQIVELRSKARLRHDPR